MAGLGMRDIKRRIKSVTNTKQITKAMEMVASAKLRKTRNYLEETRPFHRAWKQAALDFLDDLKQIDHPMITPRENPMKTGYIVVAANRGLCGGYNTNVVRKAWDHFQQKKEVVVMPVGLKSRDYFRRRGIAMTKEFLQITEMPEFIDAQDIRREALAQYQAGEMDEIYLVYTHFLSTISYQPKVVKLMPLDDEAIETCYQTEEGLQEAVESERQAKEADNWEKMSFEPTEEMVIEQIVPGYLDSLIHSGLLESAVSEQAARRVAMENATNNAEEMIENLQLAYNRARQAAITQEIAELVGGAEALK